MKTKTFDCVAMKRRGSEYVYGIIKDMTPAEELAFWRGRTEGLRQEQAARMRKTGAKVAGRGKP